MKSMMGYIGCIALAIGYTFAWDGRGGTIIVAVLIVSPILSILMTVIAKNNLTMSIECSAHRLHKGESVLLSAIFKLSGMIPAPFIEVTFFSAKNFSTTLSKYRFSIGTSNPITIQQEYTGRIWGVAQIGIEEVTISDYLGLVKFTLYKDRGLHYYANSIEIYPNIPDAPVQNELVRSICDAVAYEDREEEIENVVATGGFPGYEHKIYVPGDPIKRINWKLSSKREVLMVRLDEAIASSKQVLVLDYCNNQIKLRSDEEFKQLIQDEKIVEAVLGFLTILVKLGVESSFYYFFGGAWTQMEVASVNDIITLQHNLAKYEFQPQTTRYKLPRVPVDFIKEHQKFTTLTVFSSSFDEELSAQIITANQTGITVHSVVTEPTKLSATNVWLVTDTFELIGIGEGIYD